MEDNNPTLRCIDIELPLVPEVDTHTYLLKDTHVPVCLALVEGTHQITTPPVRLGHLKTEGQRAIMASLTLWYRYDAEHALLTLCSSNLDAQDTAHVSIGMEGDPPAAWMPVFPESTPSPYVAWNGRYVLGSPTLTTSVQNALKSINERILEKALAVGLTVEVRTPLPDLDEETFEKLLLVYHKGSFVEFYDPEKDYGHDYSVHNIMSKWAGEVYFGPADNFANVIGSTGDKKIAGLSWLQLWQKQFGQAHTCASLYYKNFPCSGGLVGGHVILGKQAKAVAHGSNSVYIIPICTAHNNNDNVYMAPLQINKGVWLMDYHNP